MIEVVTAESAVGVWDFCYLFHDVSIAKERRTQIERTRFPSLKNEAVLRIPIRDLKAVCEETPLMPGVEVEVAEARAAHYLNSNSAF